MAKVARKLIVHSKNMKSNKKAMPKPLERSNEINRTSEAQNSRENARASNFCSQLSVLG
jgi:hypothetical protein